jgi:uncharacterized protein YdaU (DUF1376 family)
VPELPYVPFYVSDWLADSSVRRMSLEQRGLYIDLLCHAWDGGSIPSDTSERAHMVGLSVPKLRKLWPKLDACWESNGNGGLVNPKMEQVRAKQKAKQTAGSKGGKAKAKGEANA